MVKNILIGLILLLFIGCNQSRNNNLFDKFFDRDVYKLPLGDSEYIYSTYLGIKGEWQKRINSSDIYMSEGLSVDSIGFIEKNNVTVIYNNLLFLSGQNPRKTWILLKNKDIIKVFFSYEEYQAFCLTEYNKKAILYEPSDLYKRYNETGKLDW